MGHFDNGETKMQMTCLEASGKNDKSLLHLAGCVEVSDVISQLTLHPIVRQ
jgi:hypothetical protein